MPRLSLECGAMLVERHGVSKGFHHVIGPGEGEGTWEHGSNRFNSVENAYEFDRHIS